MNVLSANRSPRLRARLAVCACAVLALTGASAAPAVADDAAVLTAWEANDPQFSKLSRETTRAFRAWERSDFKRSAPVFAKLRETRALLLRTRQAVGFAQPSTEPGTRAKKGALRSMKALDRSLVIDARAVRVAPRRGGPAAGRVFARAERERKRASVYARGALALFRSLGLKPREG